MSPDTRRPRVVRGGDVRVLLGAVALAPVFTEADLAAAYERGAHDARAAMSLDREASVAALAGAVQHISASLDQELAVMHAEFSERIVSDACTIARWLVRHELSANPNLMRDRVEAALRDLDDRDTVVTVSADMVDLVTEWLPGCAVRSAPELATGDVRISSAKTTVDGSIDDAISRLRDALEGAPC
jgi:flagellar biosynthesis/type III secretory pathway protein FliH